MEIQEKNQTNERDRNRERLAWKTEWNAFFSSWWLLSRAKSLINCSCTVIDFILNKTSNPLGKKQRKARLAKETEKKISISMIKIYASGIKQAWCFPGFTAFHLLLSLALTALGKFNNRAIAWLTTIMSYKDSRAWETFPCKLCFNRITWITSLNVYSLYKSGRMHFNVIFKMLSSYGRRRHLEACTFSKSKESQASKTFLKIGS